MSMKTLQAILLPLWFCLVLLSACGDRNVPSAEPAKGDAPEAPKTSSPEVGIKCNPTFTLEQCAEANASLSRDANDLAAEISAQSQANAARQKEIESQMPDPVEILQTECEMQKAVLAALQRRQSRPRGEIISKEEEDGIPADIARTERYISQNCQ